MFLPLLVLAVALQAPPPTGFTPIESLARPTGALASPITLSVQATPLGDALTQIAQRAKLAFAFDRMADGMERPVTVRFDAVPAATALQRVLDGSRFRALVGPAGQVVIARRVPDTSDVGARIGAGASAQDPLRLSGYVRSAASREVIRYAQVLIDSGVARRAANEEGFYSIALDPGRHRVRVRAIGYAPFDTTIDLVTSRALDVSLQSVETQLAAVAVVVQSPDRPDLDPLTPDMSVVRLDMRAVRVVPPVLGEPDPIRSLALLPGVSLTSDASTSFSVRGGQTDQNLILLDEATIYNPSHVLGFLSTFNTDAVDDVTLYKGAIPAKFGGRLSSVVDVRQREGNANNFRGAASVGLLASRVSVEGPLPARRGSYMIAARRSYADLFLKLASDTSVRDDQAYFYDINAKANVRLGETGAIMASAYAGQDLFSNSSAFGARWGNRAATLRWNQAFAGRVFSKATIAWADYAYGLNFSIEARDSALWKAGITSVELKLDEQVHLTRAGVLEFGLHLQGQEFRPGTITPDGASSQIQRRTVAGRTGLTSSFYVGHEVELGSRIALRYGVRSVDFRRLGSTTIYRYANGAPITYDAALARYESGVVVDSVRYGTGETVSRFGGLEPRASVRFSLDAVSSLKLSFARTRQYLQLVSNTNSPIPLDVWEPSGPYLRPQVGDQVALGYSLTRGRTEVSVEAYARAAKDLVDYVDGADLVLNERVETIAVQGDGRSAGVEFLVRRSTGPLSGWVSYTLSRSVQRFPARGVPGAPPEAGINGGRWYLSPADKRHNLSVVAMWERSTKWTYAATFALASGLPTTLPVSRYEVDGILIAEYGDRNANRLPVYHRLDVSATRTLRHGEFQFGLLNAYNRFNAQSLHVRQQLRNPLVTEAVRTSIFGIVPTLTYVFRF